MKAIVRQRDVAAADARVFDRKCTLHDVELHRIDQFKYLGRPVVYTDNATPTICLNIAQVR